MHGTKRRYLSLPLTLAWVISGPAFALEPCGDPDEYYDTVDRVIDRAVGRPAELALTVFPSFWAEYGVRMIGHEIHVVQLRPSMWVSSIVKDGSWAYHHDFKQARVGTVVYKASLRPALAVRIRRTFADALGAWTVGPSGQDGVGYRFAVRGVGCGTTWSPRRETFDGRLVQLADLLVSRARRSAPFTMQLSEKEILRLLSEIERAKANANWRGW
jgi:hypothetical protein